MSKPHSFSLSSLVNRFLEYEKKETTPKKKLVSTLYPSNPFYIGAQYTHFIKQKTKHLIAPQSISRFIFDWMEEHIAYGKTMRKQREITCKNTEETLYDREGVCCEMSFAYVALARSCGLESYVVDVKEDYKGREVHHNCAYVAFGEGLFVDVAYHRYDINHKTVRILDDEEIIRIYRGWRKKLA